MNTPERDRYNRAISEMGVLLDAAPADKRVVGLLHGLRRSLSRHRPEDGVDPDCEECGMPWPCPTAEHAMLTVGVES